MYVRILFVPRSNDCRNITTLKLLYYMIHTDTSNSKNSKSNDVMYVRMHLFGQASAPIYVMLTEVECRLRLLTYSIFFFIYYVHTYIYKYIVITSTEKSPLVNNLNARIMCLCKYVAFMLSTNPFFF